MSMINVRSEITGSVWKILVKPGDSVAEDDSLLILESMKIRVAEGDAIAEGDVAVVLEI